MPVINRFADLAPAIAAWRQDLHAHPEILFETHRTSAVVADKLRAFGCDEVATGIGRTGDWLAHDPALGADIVTLAKGLGGGLPIGAVLATGRAATLLQPGQHGSTFAGNPICAAAALAVLATVAADGLIDHAAALGKHIGTGVEDLGHPLIAGVRGRGLLLGIVLRAPIGPAAAAAARAAGAGRRCRRLPRPARRSRSRRRAWAA